MKCYRDAHYRDSLADHAESCKKSLWDRLTAGLCVASCQMIAQHFDRAHRPVPPALHSGPAASIGSREGGCLVNERCGITQDEYMMDGVMELKTRGIHEKIEEWETTFTQKKLMAK